MQIIATRDLSTKTQIEHIDHQQNTRGLICVMCMEEFVFKLQVMVENQVVVVTNSGCIDCCGIAHRRGPYQADHCYEYHAQGSGHQLGVRRQLWYCTSQGTVQLPAAIA